MSLTQINRRKSCVNIPRSKKGAHKHKYNYGLSVRAKRLKANRTSGETTVIRFSWSFKPDLWILDRTKINVGKSVYFVAVMFKLFFLLLFHIFVVTLGL